MRRNRLRIRAGIYPLLWSIIAICSVYLLVRFATLSFSDDVGQAGGSIKDDIIVGLCKKVMESGSSLISYSTKEDIEEAYVFPVNLIADEFVLPEFVKDNSLTTVKAQETSFLFQQNENDNKKITEEEDQDTIQTSSSGKKNYGFRFRNYIGDSLSKEYVLSNGTIYNDNFTKSGLTDGLAESSGMDGNSSPDQLQVSYLKGDIEFEETEDDTDVSGEGSSIETVNTDAYTDYSLDQLKDINFLVSHFYIVDSSTKITESLFDAKKLLSNDMTIKQDNQKPQILIYHSHSQETYADSRVGKREDTVVGVGSYLTEILKTEYGYNVIHDTSCYDLIDGVLDRNKAYTKAEEGIEKILKENPTIEVVIDLHRDGSKKRSTEINGEETAQIMLFNGLSRDRDGPLTGLDNPNLQNNLSFSLQLQLKSRKLYPGLFYKNYLKSYRYNMHVRPKCILMELGTDKNTLQSAKNAMGPFAEILDDVLQGK